MIWYNKDTETGVRTIERPDDWDNPKNNFTPISPGAECVAGLVKCSWNETEQKWDIDSGSLTENTRIQTLIQALKNSPFYKISKTEVDTTIDNQFSSLTNGQRAVLKQMNYTIAGLLEYLRLNVTKGL